MPTDHTLAESILRAHLLVALAELERLRVSLPTPVVVELADGQRDCRLTVSDRQADDDLTPAACPADGGPDRQPHLRERLLSAAGPDPRTPRRLARIAGAKYNSHLRTVLTQLCREGRLLKLPDGIVRAPDPTPATGPPPAGGQSPADSRAG